jgi:hypothetical protein
MKPLSSPWTFVFAVFLAMPNCLAADRTPTESNPVPKAAPAGQIADWIRQLNSPRFAERTEASRRLEEAGKSAFPALVKAALGDSREATLRAIEILRKHAQEGDESTKTAAKEALQKIAGSDHASAARRAKEALSPPKPTPPVPNIQLGPIVPNLPVGQQRIQVQIQVNAFGGNQTRRIQINNGVKQTEVTDKDLKVKITEDAQGGIQMDVTRKKDGKETTEKYSAKTADELKKKHPDAGKLYEKYGQQLGGGIQIRALPAVHGAAPPIPVQPKTDGAKP